MLRFVFLMMITIGAAAQTVTVEKYDNGVEQTGLRYQMDVGIKDASSGQIAAMPINSYAPPVSWSRVGDDMWRGTSETANCDAWIIDGDIGLNCYSSSPF